jgi:hypothetical protein
MGLTVKHGHDLHTIGGSLGFHRTNVKAISRLHRADV